MCIKSYNRALIIINITTGTNNNNIIYLSYNHFAKKN